MEDTQDIPLRHIEIVLNRIANTKEEDFVDWNQAKLLQEKKGF